MEGIDDIFEHIIGGDSGGVSAYDIIDAIQIHANSFGRVVSEKKYSTP